MPHQCLVEQGETETDILDSWVEYLVHLFENSQKFD